MFSSLIASQSQTQTFFQASYSNRKNRIYSYYTSNFGKIITQESKMLIPIDDRMAIRGHAVFDVIYYKKGNLINMRHHVERLVASSHSVHVSPPFSIEEMETKIKEVVGATLELLVKEGETRDKVKNRVFVVRLHISSGYGDFGISSLGKQPIFSIIVSDPHINYEVQKLGVKEYVVLQSQPKQLVHSKTVNYIQNTLMANLSKEKGGYLGIKMTKDKVILQASIANVAFMFGKVFVSPRLETVIKGTTITKCLKKLEELKGEGVIEDIVFRDVALGEAYEASEMMIIGGDKIVPVLYLDDHLIGEKKGQITGILQDWYQEEIEQGTSVPFDEKA